MGVPGGFWESKLAELVPHQVLGGQGEMNSEGVQYKHVAGQGGKQAGWQQRDFLRSGGMCPGEGLWRKPVARLDEHWAMGDRMYQELEGKWRLGLGEGGLALVGSQQSRRGDN